MLTNIDDHAIFREIGPGESTLICAQENGDLGLGCLDFVKATGVAEVHGRYLAGVAVKDIEPFGADLG